MNIGGKDRTVGEISRVFGVAAQLIVTVVADREEIIVRLETAAYFLDEIVDLAILFTILRTADRIFVGNFVGPDDVEDEHVDRWIVEPLPRFPVNERVAFQQRRMDVFVIERIDKGIWIKPVQSVVRRDNQPHPERGE